MATPQKTPARSAAPAKQAAKPAAAPAKQAARAAAPPLSRPAPPAAAARPQPAAQAPRGSVAQAAPVQDTEHSPAAVSQSTAVAHARPAAVTTREDVPDYIKQSQGRGSENVEMQDVLIPRIELVQALSKCLEEGSTEYIEGARPGMFYNSVTRLLYGARVLVCPVFFKKQYLAWRDRQKGGGFGGAHDTLQEAQERIEQQERPDEWEAIETAQQLVLVVDPDTYETSEAVLSCARTKMKVSRQWNSLIRVNGFDRFSRLYELFGTDETNSVNQPYKNIGVSYVNFAPVPVFKAAEALYNMIASGTREVKIDDNYIDAGMGSEDMGPGGAQPDDPGASSEY